MYRTVFTPSEISDLTIQLPKEYLHKQVEVIAFDVDKESKVVPKSVEGTRERITEALENFTKVDMTNSAFEQETFEKAFGIFDSMRVSTKGYKFDRDEANER